MCVCVAGTVSVLHAETAMCRPHVCSYMELCIFPFLMGFSFDRWQIYLSRKLSLNIFRVVLRSPAAQCVFTASLLLAFVLHVDFGKEVPTNQKNKKKRDFPAVKTKDKHLRGCIRVQILSDTLSVFGDIIKHKVDFTEVCVYIFPVVPNVLKHTLLILSQRNSRFPFGCHGLWRDSKTNTWRNVGREWTLFLFMTKLHLLLFNVT